jgi:hypothetical protein
MEQETVQAIGMIALHGKIELTSTGMIDQLAGAERRLDADEIGLRLIYCANMLHWARSLGWKVWFTLRSPLGARQVVIIDAHNTSTIILSDGSMELYEHVVFALDFVAARDHLTFATERPQA